MIDLKSLVQKILEWAVVAALVGVIGYLVGNSEAMMMRAEIDRLRADVDRHERERIKAEDQLRAVQAGRRIFMNGAVGPLNYLCEKDEGCRNRFGTLTVPE